MSVLRHRVRAGAYLDSIVLMQLQVALAGEPGVSDCSAVMATAANLAILESTGLLPQDLAEEMAGGSADDLLIVIKAEDESAADAALDAIDRHLERRSVDTGAEDDLPPPASLRQALRRLPEANWAAISVPGRWAARVARQALDQGLDVFLYSDNVAEADELALKRAAAARGRLMLGPDCGTAILGGIGFGFANHVRRGRIGLVGASGTGLQTISSRIHALGAGTSHAIGVGGRDLQASVGGLAALRALAALAADPDTAAIVIVSKPPAAEVLRRLVAACLGVPKPVVLALLGSATPVPKVANLCFVPGLEAAAVAAVAAARRPSPVPGLAFAPGYLRALFAGGTLALETLCQLRFFLPLVSNLGLDGVEQLVDPSRSRGHTVIDMGDDALTVGRLHPMIDPELRLRRLDKEAADRAVSTILLDVVLGEGAEADPAGRLAPAIEAARSARKGELEILVVLVGSGRDPQGLADQQARLEAAGARVWRRLGDALEAAVQRLVEVPVLPAAAAIAPPAVINLGLETFYDSFARQGARAVHVAWRPPAGGDKRLVALLDAMETRA